MLPIKTIIKNIRITVKDTDEEQNSYKDEELMMYVNAGIRFIRRTLTNINPLMLADYEKTFKLDGGKNEIDLESNVSKVIEVVADGRKLTAVNYLEAYKNKGGLANSYSMIGTSKLKIYPIPQSGAEVSVLAINDSGELNINDVSPFNTDIDDLIIEYAVIRCGMSDRFTMAQETALFSTLVGQLQDIACVEGITLGEGY